MHNTIAAPWRLPEAEGAAAHGQGAALVVVREREVACAVAPRMAVVDVRAGHMAL